MQTCLAATWTGVARALRNLPAALVDEPVDERADRIRERLSRSPIAEMLRVPYGSGTGSATTAGCRSSRPDDGESGT